MVCSPVMCEGSGRGVSTDKGTVAARQGRHPYLGLLGLMVGARTMRCMSAYVHECVEREMSGS